MVTWYVYILKCSDATLYTGVTTDIERRLMEHNLGKKGAKYTRARRPSQLVWSDGPFDKSKAHSLEHSIKSRSRKSKLEIIQKKIRFSEKESEGSASEVCASNPENPE